MGTFDLPQRCERPICQQHFSPSSKRPFVLEKFPVHCNTQSLKLRDNCLGITFAWSLTNEVTVSKGSNSWLLKKPGQWSPEERWSQPTLLLSYHCFPQSSMFYRSLWPANRAFLGMDGNDWSQACGLISDIKTWIHRKQDLVDDIYTIQAEQHIVSYGTHPGEMKGKKL